jgi:lipopolysaccharide/colanic/teichoic acid biosynthesis glycosyltransferase
MTQLLKRFMDVGGAITGLLLFSPVLLVAYIATRATLGKPVLYIQERTGLNDRVFLIYKFRTMDGRRYSSGELLPDVERLTWTGRALRKVSFDELPQFWNVLRGEMSLVGPRPLLPEYLPRYTKIQRRRHEVRPGITGWAQVNGRNALTWGEKFDLDVWYVDNCSLRLDIKILWLTLLKVLRQDGISQHGHSTMPEFMGTANVTGQHE